jgi:hypothetical protein
MIAPTVDGGADLPAGSVRRRRSGRTRHHRFRRVTYHSDMEARESAAPVATSLADLRNGAQAQRTLTELREPSKRWYISRYDIAVIYAGLGDKRQALEGLKKAYEERHAWVAWLKVDPRFDGLHDAPRFQSLLRRMGLPP